MAVSRSWRMILLHEGAYTTFFMNKQDLALSWSQRIQIALGVAKGLCYIHDNIRSNNISICDDETAKIIDPFLWTQRCEAASSVNECHPYPLANRRRSDVYNFGEILLELLTGSKLVDNTRQAEQRQLVSRIVDARLKADHPRRAIKKMAKVAQLCLRDETYKDADSRTSSRAVSWRNQIATLLELKSTDIASYYASKQGS
ncbi:putative receptor-like protein kinase [Salvia divinorum]|uniref:Receptor-like protein kinase n=1 Tax=Salvia divinorum TaxID=28513 RepID=A0ABD1GG26_SALDI